MDREVEVGHGRRWATCSSLDPEKCPARDGARGGDGAELRHEEGGHHWGLRAGLAS
jgi:hypothetical protein